MKVSGIGVQTHSQVKTGHANLTDLIWLVAAGAVLLGLVSLGEFLPDWAKYLVPLRLPLGIIYVLFAPGYLLQCSLFPRNDDLDAIERLGLSLGLSIGLVPVLALLLDKLPWGLRLWPIVIAQVLLVVLLFIGATVRRLLLPVEETFAPQFHLAPGRWWHSVEPYSRKLLTITGVALLMAVLVTVYVFVVPSKAEFMTEFYMLGKEGVAEDYPRLVNANEPVYVTAGITNREGKVSTYSIQVLVDDQVIGQAGPITLEDQATWQGQLEFALPNAGDDQEVRLVLSREGQSSPYRTLRLWINVMSAAKP